MANAGLGPCRCTSLRRRKMTERGEAGGDRKKKREGRGVEEKPILAVGEATKKLVHFKGEKSHRQRENHNLLLAELRPDLLSLVSFNAFIVHKAYQARAVSHARLCVAVSARGSSQVSQHVSHQIILLDF